MHQKAKKFYAWVQHDSDSKIVFTLVNSKLLFHLISPVSTTFVLE